MREIKFRVWDKEKKKMYLDVQNHFDCDGCFQERGTGPIPKCYVPAEHFGQFLNNPKFEVMQYTGLKDKNGKEIYEGDLVETYLGGGCFGVGIIEFHEIKLSNGPHEEDAVLIYGWVIAEQHTVELETGKKTRIAYSVPCSETVVGNIYENPELIKND